MKRIKGKYVGRVILDFDVPRDDDTYPLERIRNSVCGGELTEAIRCALSDEISDVIVTVVQQFADVYEVDAEGAKDGIAEEAEKEV